jgi:circadian clock protein KaiC
MHDLISAFKPTVVAIDPISNLTLDHDEAAVKPTLMRLIDFLKQRGITALFTSLTSGGASTTAPEDSQVGVSSLMDAWLLLRNVENNGERNRTVFVLKARGMAHSNQVREFILSDNGIDLAEVYLGQDGVLTGTARLAQEARDRVAARTRKQQHEHRMRTLESRRKALDAQIATLQAQREAETAEIDFALDQEQLQEKTALADSEIVARRRGGNRK